jgi:hypothetical protein
MLVSETDVDVPAIVAGRVVGGEADRKGPKAVARVPTAGADQLIESYPQLRRIRRFPEGGFAELAEAYDRPGPCRAIIRIASGGFPKYRASLVGGVRAECLIDTDEAVAHERGNIVCAEHRI